MRHKLSTVVYTQGWLSSQIESSVEAASKSEDENQIKVAAQIKEMWTVIDEALDDLIAERREMERKLAVVESAFK